MVKHIFMLIGILAILLVGCSQAPNDLAEKTQTVLDDAKAAQADIYFPLRFMAVRDSVSVALAEIEHVKAKFFMHRHYDHAEQLLLQAYADLTAMIEKTALKKEETKLEVQQMLVDIHSQIEQARRTMPDANKIRQNRDFVTNAEVEVLAVESDIPILNQLLENGDYLTAWNKATSHLEKLNQLNIDLKTSVAKTTVKRTKALG